MKRIIVVLLILPFVGLTQTESLVDFESPKTYFGKYVQLDIEPLLKEVSLKGFQYYDVQRILGVYPKNIDERIQKRINCPNAFLQQCDSSVLYGVVNTGEVYSIDYAWSTSNFGRPFYYKTTEVTNAEYREFLNYVRDSTILNRLSEIYPQKFKTINKAGKEVLNWKMGFLKLMEKEEYRAVIDSLFYTLDSSQFYKNRQITMAVYQYKFTKSDGEEIELNLYPDTLSWVHNIRYSWAEPMTQMYFWHPVYDNYPVVGVSYNQALAFLDWLGKKGIPSLDKKGIKYSIGLPRPEEGEFAVTVEGAKAFLLKSEKQKEFMARSYYDRSVAFDLILKNPSVLSTYRNAADSLTAHEVLVRKNSLKNKLIDPFDNFNESWVEDGGIFTLESSYANPNFKHLHSINNNLFHMGSNVSEWQDVQFDAYCGFAKTQALTLQNSRYQDVRTAGKEYEDLFSKFKSTDQLVMGGNWMDESYDVHLGVPLKSIYKKTFANPDSSYSTVGFRYVVRLLPEENVAKKEVVSKPFTVLNIFEVLKESGFTLQNDTVGKMIVDYDSLVFKMTEVPDTSISDLPKSMRVEGLDGKHINVTDGVYLSSNFPNSHQRIRAIYPSIYNSIYDLGGDFDRFYSVIPGVSKKVIGLYQMECHMPSVITLYLK